MTYEFRAAAPPSPILGRMTIDDPAVSAVSPWQLTLTHALGGETITQFWFDLTSVGGPVAVGQYNAMGQTGFITSDGPTLTGPDGSAAIFAVLVTGEAWFEMRAEVGGDLFRWTDYSDMHTTIGPPGDWVVAVPAPGMCGLVAASTAIGARRRRR